MDRDHKREDFASLLCGLYSLCALELTLWQGGLAVHKALLYGAVLLWAAACFFCRRKERPWLPVGGALLLLLAGWIKYRDGLFVLFNGTEGLEEVSLRNDCSVLAFLLVLYFLLYLIARNRFLRPALAAGWLLFWLHCALKEVALPKAALVFMLPALLYELARLANVLGAAGKKVDFDAVRAPIISFLSMGCVILLLIPTFEEPYHWRLPRIIAREVQAIYHKLETKWILFTNSSTEFGLGFFGAGGSSLLGQWDEETGSTMGVATSFECTGPLYLRGNAWERFDGSGWSSRLSDEDELVLNSVNDMAEHLYALWRYVEEGGDLKVSDFYHSNNVRVVYYNTKTRTLFCPPNLLSIKTDLDANPWSQMPAGLRFDYVQDDADYTVSFLEENSRTLPGLIRASESWTYGQEHLGIRWARVSSDFWRYFRAQGLGITPVEQSLVQRQQRIYEIYSEVPDFVSQRVYDLAHEITAGCDSTYDKLQAIETYLRENYRYTDQPPQVPDGANFLDWFLFEQEEGYCTWFATAASMLARCEGIPSRYVQGYCVALDENKSAFLTNQEAHAWSECYVPGYGWITVEATPGYEAGGSGSWLTAKELGIDDTALEIPGEEEETDVPAPFLPDRQGEEAEPKPLPELPKEEETVELSPQKQLNPVVKYVLIGGGVLLLAVGLVIYDRKVLVYKRRYDAADYSGKARLDLERICALGHCLGCTREESESIALYFRRLCDHEELSRPQGQELARFYEAVFFGGRELSEEQWKESRWLREELERRLRRRWWNR